MERRLVIRGSFMSGYGFPGLLAFVGAIGAINAVLTRIWASRVALTVWLIIIGGGVVAIFAVEAISRRNVVEVRGDRIRWSLRQPPDKGDQPISNLRRVEVFPAAACLVFVDCTVAASGVDFRRSDLTRLVEGLRAMGATVDDLRSSTS
jgi:hypothetical protein